MLRSLALAAALLAALASPAAAQDEGAITVRLSEAPRGGQLCIWLFDKDVTFGRFSDPIRLVRFPVDGVTTEFTVSEVPPGVYAFVVHHDLDSNSEFNKNFIAIPREPIAISRDYRPKGPPVYARANFVLAPGEVRVEELELYQVLGKNGLIGVGLGVVGRSSVYPGGDAGVFQPIPAITYNGSNLQWFGPTLLYGLVGNDTVRLAATASYRIRAYEEGDSPALVGLDDRKDTLLAGLAVIAELPYGVNGRLGYEHDVLDQIGGGVARLDFSRSFQAGITRWTPSVAAIWTSSDLANHDFGVPESGAIPGRPAYAVGDALSFEAGVGSFIEFTREWRLILNVAVEFLPDEVTRSPIVSEDVVLKGFFAVTYVF